MHLSSLLICILQLLFKQIFKHFAVGQQTIQSFHGLGAKTKLLLQQLPLTQLTLFANYIPYSVIGHLQFWFRSKKE